VTFVHRNRITNVLKKLIEVCSGFSKLSPGRALDDDHLMSELASSCQSSADRTPQHFTSVCSRFQTEERNAQKVKKTIFLFARRQQPMPYTYSTIEYMYITVNPPPKKLKLYLAIICPSHTLLPSATIEIIIFIFVQLNNNLTTTICKINL
jgi:hypothetical protein